MTDFVIYGNPASPCLRSVCAALEEKGKPYRIERFGPDEFRGERHLKLHPFGRIPAIDHGGYKLYETQAILRYVDALFPDPALQPKDPEAIGRMSQIMGINDCYLFPQVARIIVFHRIVGPALMGTKPDEDAIARAIPDAELCLGELNRLLGDQPFLAGDELTLADLLLAPQVYFLAATPEGTRIMKDTALLAWLNRVNARPSMQATLPPEAFRLAA
ncbi:MAG: glutathione S-transferase family protein [Rhodomicrobium sp.]